ncbi:preprotein translocase subunit YajC [Actinomadura kijaniata]|uniref:preprotein translocase subunit YajC n=1 Tax=Actinomadura kijaniata TaxID=46161 RepID=UPI0008365A02|nr:preprotein translocase subunit YajC [Actinomadura kijaniata]
MGNEMILAAQNSGSGAFNLLLLLAVPVVFYFLLIRPQNKRRKEQLRMQNSVAPGAKVVTTAGMHATVVEVDDDGVVLEIAPGVHARFVRQAVMQVVREDAAADDADTLDGDEGKPAGGSIDLSKDDTGADDAEKAEKAEKAESKATEKPSA